VSDCASCDNEVQGPPVTTSCYNEACTKHPVDEPKLSLQVSDYILILLKLPLLRETNYSSITDLYQILLFGTFTCCCFLFTSAPVVVFIHIHVSTS